MRAVDLYKRRSRTLHQLVPRRYARSGAEGPGAAVGAASCTTWDLATPMTPAVAMTSTAETIRTVDRPVTLRAAPATVGVTMDASAPATNRAVNPVAERSGKTWVTQMEKTGEPVM